MWVFFSMTFCLLGIYVIIVLYKYWLLRNNIYRFRTDLLFLFRSTVLENSFLGRKPQHPCITLGGIVYVCLVLERNTLSVYCNVSNCFHNDLVIGLRAVILTWVRSWSGKIFSMLSADWQPTAIYRKPKMLFEYILITIATQLTRLGKYTIFHDWLSI